LSKLKRYLDYGKTMLYKRTLSLSLSFLVIFTGCFVHELWIGHELVPILLRTFGLITAFLGVAFWIKHHTK